VKPLESLFDRALVSPLKPKRLCRVDYLVVPGKILSELQKSSADLDESSGFSRVLSPEGAKAAQLEEVRCAQLLLGRSQRPEKVFQTVGWADPVEMTTEISGAWTSFRLILEAG
jgi:hypothetical protein